MVLVLGSQFSLISTYMLKYVTTRFNPTLWIVWGFDGDSPPIFVPLSGLAFLALEQYGVPWDKASA
jgi:hypothetical protein